MAGAQATTQLQAWREQAGFTQTECAELTGYSTAMWSRAERGERVFSPQAKVLIARRLGVRVGEIFPVEPAEAV